MDEDQAYHDFIAACDRQILAGLDARLEVAADNQAKRYAEGVGKALQPRPPRPARRKAGPRQRGCFG
jgi:hypothetical protein